MEQLIDILDVVVLGGAFDQLIDRSTTPIFRGGGRGLWPCGLHILAQIFSIFSFFSPQF